MGAEKARLRSLIKFESASQAYAGSEERRGARRVGGKPIKRRRKSTWIYSPIESHRTMDIVSVTSISHDRLLQAQ